MLNLVLDLDGTLIDSYDYPLVDRPYDLKIPFNNGSLYIYKRPNVDEFLLYCLSIFSKVGIFTASKRDYAYCVLSQCFGKYLKDFMFILTQEDCYFEVNEDRNVVIIRKLLERIWKDTRLNIYTPENTLFIDDNEYVFDDNPHNTLLIKSFSCLNNEEDITLVHLITFFRIYLNKIHNPAMLNTIYQLVNAPLTG